MDKKEKLTGSEQNELELTAENESAKEIRRNALQVADMIRALPEDSDALSESGADVRAAVEAYDSLNDEEKAEIEKELTEKLQSAMEQCDAYVKDKTEAEPKVQYETNDNWQFEAEAPTLSSEIELGAGSTLVVESPKAEAPKKPEVVKSQPAQDTIVINKNVFKIAGLAFLGVVIAVVLVFAGIYYYTVPNQNEKMNPGNVAFSVDGTDISVGMYNYYYDYLVSSYETYAAYGYYDLNTSSDYSKQYTTDNDGNEISWLQRFEDDTIYQIQYLAAYYNAGVKAGITLTDEQQEAMASQVSSIEEAASSAGQSVNEYVEENYGAYCGIKTIEKILEMNYIGESYYYQAQILFTPTDEEAAAYAEENRETYLSCSFAYLELAYDSTDDDTIAASIAAAEEYSEKISSVDELIACIPEACADLIEEYISYGYFTDEKDAVEQLSAEVEISETKPNLTDMLGEDIAEWLFSDDTAVGDTNYTVNEDYGYIYILLKTAEPAFDETELYSVRHILITPGEDSEDADTNEDADADSDTDSDTDEDAEITEEEWAAALEKANDILDKFNAGDKTEYAFAQLAEEYSDDTESTSSGSSGLYGGLYEGVPLGEMVSEFEDWATDSDRRRGDTGIVKSTYGYHIMYFVFDGATYLYNAGSDLKAENEDSFIDSATVKKSASGFKNTNTAAPSTESTTDSTASSDDTLADTDDTAVDDTADSTGE